MAKQILVPVSRNDRVKEMIPYVERVAQPGMKVVFLLRFPVDGFQECIRAGMTTGETGIPNPDKVNKLGARYSLESQQQLAQRRVYPACDAVQKKGAEVSVEVYSRYLREVLREYAANGDVHLIVQRTGIGHLISRFFNDLISAVRWIKSPNSSPTLSIVANCWPQ